MLFAEAREMLGQAFGPGDLADKINKIVKPTRDGVDFTSAQASQLIDWMADQLTDEGRLDEDGKGSTG